MNELLFLLSLPAPSQQSVFFCHNFSTIFIFYKTTNRSFHFASPHLWNQLPVSFCQSTDQSSSHSLHFKYCSCTSSSSLPSPPPLPLTILFTLSSKPTYFTSLSHRSRLLVPYTPYLHLATSEMWCWSRGRGILKKKLFVLQYCVLL